MFWPFKKKPAPPADLREWNEDWRVGDTAEVVRDNWCEDMPPWEHLPLGAQYTVIGFKDDFGDYSGTRRYFLKLDGLPRMYSTTAFRKVRPVAKEESEIVERILKAKPGKDKTRPANPVEA